MDSKVESGLAIIGLQRTAAPLQGRPRKHAGDLEPRLSRGCVTSPPCRVPGTGAGDLGVSLPTFWAAEFFIVGALLCLTSIPGPPTR